MIVSIIKQIKYFKRRLFFAIFSPVGGSVREPKHAAQ